MYHMFALGVVFWAYGFQWKFAHCHSLDNPAYLGIIQKEVHSS